MQEIEAALGSSELEQSWDRLLAEWSGPAETARALRDWIAAERTGVLEVVRSAIDPSDLETGLMVRYIEIRSQWIRYNALANYRLLRTGTPDLEIMYRGSLISSLIAAIEPFIDQHDLTKACEFLASPVASR